MAQYSGEVAHLFSQMTVQHIKTYIETLDINDVKVFYAEVLPQINDLERRKQIKQFLSEQEKNAPASVLEQTETVTQRLQNTYEHLTKKALSALKNDETRELVIERATDDELFVLEQTIKKLKDEQFQLIQQAIYEEQGKRVVPNENPMYRLKQHKNLQWNAGIWEKIIKNTNEANLEIRNRPVAKPVESNAKAKPGFFSIAWNFIKTSTVAVGKWALLTPFKSFAQTFSSIWNKWPSLDKNTHPVGRILYGGATLLVTAAAAAATFWIPTAYNYFVKPFVNAYNKYQASKPKPYDLKIEPEEAEKINKMRESGAADVSRKTAVTAVGEAKSRNEWQIEKSMMTRFGMVLASQMVSGTKGKPGTHRAMGSVIGSLVDLDDTDLTYYSIYKAVTSVIPNKPKVGDPDILNSTKNPLKKKGGEHAFGIGGEPELVVAFESQVVNKLVTKPESYESMGLKFTKEEREQIQSYHKNQGRSVDLVHMIQNIGANWGGYEKVPGQDNYRRIADEKLAQEKQEEFETKLVAAGKDFQRRCMNLKDGEALYLETGLEKHAMQLVIKKINGEYKLSTYDSSGGLENTTNKNSLLGLFKLSRMGNEAMRKNSLTFTVPESRLNSKEGLNYLTYLIRSNTMVGWAETHIEGNVRHTSMEEREHMGTGIMGWLREKFALKDQAYVYQKYIDKFSSLASPDKPPRFEELLQRPQNTGNCYAKKIQSNELYELGKPLYKKVRLATLLEQRQALLGEICGDRKGEPSFVEMEYNPMLRNLEPEYLSPEELHEVSMRLTEINKPPSKQYYTDYFNSLLAVKEQLQKKTQSDANDRVIARIDKKIATRSKELYAFLKKTNKNDEIKQLFDKAVTQEDFKWDGKVIPLKSEGRKIDPKAFDKLCAHSAALAWKASLQLMNHQIKKLSVKERHIHSPEERLSNVSHGRVSGKVTLHDLEDANIVTFVEGFGRKEDSKVEINVGGTRKEIDKATFFRLVVANKYALTSPKVISVLDALRNTKPEVEQRYERLVYPAQRQAFIEKLDKRLLESDVAIKAAIKQLETAEAKVKELMSESKKNTDAVQKEIDHEEKLLGKGKQSVKLKNLEARKELLVREMKELNQLKVTASNSLINLRGTSQVETSPAAIKSKVEAILQKLKDNPEDLRTINSVSHSFRDAQVKLDGLQRNLDAVIKGFEVDEVERQSNSRLQEFAKYRAKVIRNHLGTNAEYRVLDELATGQFGAEYIRNREMHAQTPSERAKFYREGKNTFLEGSVPQEIQHFNQKLRAQVIGIIEYQVLVGTDAYSPNSVDSMASGNRIYVRVNDKAQQFSQASLPLSVKEEWMKGMFAIWLKHERTETLFTLQSKPDADAAIKEAFHHYLEQKANIKYASIKEAGFPIELSKEALGWKPITEDVLEQSRAQRKKVENTIREKMNALSAAKPKKMKEVEWTLPPVKLAPSDLVAQLGDRAEPIKFAVPKESKFISFYTDIHIDGSTLDFLGHHTLPLPPAVSSQEECSRYFEKVGDYLRKLKAYNGLENKEERIIEFCHAAASHLAKLTFPPSSQLVNEITDAMLARYKDETGSFDEAFMKLENTQRAQILTNLIQLNLTQVPLTDDSKTKVDSKFYSTVKQWERLITPVDGALADKIKKLEPGGNIPVDFAPIKAVDSAIQYSPIGLEGLYEGQKGLDIALTEFGRKEGQEVDADLRKLADRLGMRNGGKLLVHQFKQFYLKNNTLITTDGLNSTVGRELFARAFTDALENASDEDKKDLIHSLNTIRFEPKDAELCILTVKFDEFLEEMKIRASIIAPTVFAQTLPDKNENYVPIRTQFAIEETTAPKEKDGLKRLFGFAREMNLLSLKIESARANNAAQKEIDALHAQLICSNLAYRLMYDQTPEDTLIGMSNNFEYSREIALAQANINRHQKSIVAFSSSLNEAGKAAVFEQQFKAYTDAKKFNDVMVKLTGKPTSSPIPGFISLGGINSLDTLHGALYVGSNKLGFMPAYIQSHIDLEMLHINRLPFRPVGGGYLYTEGKKIKASITPQKNGSLIIQRELKTLDGEDAVLQYISPEKMDKMLPISLRRRVNAEHFFIDAQGAIHAFTEDFTPVLKVTNQHNIWSGHLLDKKGVTTSVLLDHNLPIINALAQVFPPEEMIAVDKSTLYVPALSKFIIKAPESANYFIADSKEDLSSRRHLELSEGRRASTHKVLVEAEKIEVAKLTQKIEELYASLESLKTKSGLLNKQSKAQIEKSIRESEARIRAIETPEQFVFVEDSPQLKALEEKHNQLRQKMLNAYTAFQEGTQNREALSANYDQTKAAYFEIKRELSNAYARADYLRVYHNEGGALKPKGFQSILHLSSVEGKTALLTQMLGENVPTELLKKNELEALHNVQEQYANSTTKEERLARVMLLGTEIQHYILERAASATGKLSDWDRDVYAKQVGAFKEAVEAIASAKESFPLEQFSELWHGIQSEFTSEKQFDTFFSKSVNLDKLPPLLKQPLNLHAKTTDMPIETLGGRTQVHFKVYDQPAALMDKEQVELADRLRNLEGYRKSTQAQEDGYVYENFGLFNRNTLEQLFSVSAKDGVESLSKADISGLIHLMNTKGWIRPVQGMDDKFQVVKHPSEFFSSVEVGAYLTEQGFQRASIKTIVERLETFLYQTAVSSGTYTSTEKHKEELIEKVAEEQKKCNMEFLAAQYGLETLMSQSKTELTFSDLNAAYLTNDYRAILSNFPVERHAEIQRYINNSMARMLYYKTEWDHFNDVKSTFDMGGQDSKAISMLHIRRNYSLDKLFESKSRLSSDAKPEEIKKEEQDQKMQRAFLLFEYEFGHRCNTRQVNIFRSLLLDDENDPDKIDSAQARMGFGKTTLLPLVALYKTGGEQLVRFIVPKSALETNTSDMSTTLFNVVGKRAVKDDFQRYRIASDPEADMLQESPRLKSLRDVKHDLQKRFALYEKIRENREVLVQAPSVRNAMECQAKMFLDILMNSPTKPTPTEVLQTKELMECITLMNKIRSMSTVSVFDELDATQNSATTDVNYTSGNKVPLDPQEIYPLEVITETIRDAKTTLGELEKNKGPLADLLLDKFNIRREERASIKKYILCLEEPEPGSVTPANSTQTYLMRAILTDDVMLSIFTKKQPGTAYGVWFQNGNDGTKKFDYDALRTADEAKAKNPLLITVPYSAANTPKPQGSRFDNPEVTAMTTFLYYLDPQTEVSSVPHLEFLVESFRTGLGEKPYLDPTGQHIEPEFEKALEIIREIADIPETVSRNSKRDACFEALKAIPVFRKMLARAIIQDQIKFDAGKANSNRYEQGTTHDTVIGFSGTAGDTSSHFKENMLDPAADGNMTLGIMARKENQHTHTLDTSKFSGAEEGYTAAMVAELTKTFCDNTRTLIDVGGLCKVSNRQVALEIAKSLKKSPNSKLKDLEGVIFYDDVTNMKKVLILDQFDKETIKDLTPDLVAKSDHQGSFFTYYDQSHSRGADIKQMNGAEAVLTASKDLENNDYKQAIMRMRKIIDRNLGQSFSIAVTDEDRLAILSALKYPPTHQLTGNDLAFWLRENELKNNLCNPSILGTELDAIVKNAILQQQGEITRLTAGKDLSLEQVERFKTCIKELNDISKFIAASEGDLQAKYGGVFGTVKKETFIKEIQERFERRIMSVFTAVNKARDGLALNAVDEKEKKPYFDMRDRIVLRRRDQLPSTFTIPNTKGNALSEAHSETENQSQSQSESQSQSQTQTHSFSEVNNEEIVVDVRIKKPNIEYQPPKVDFLAGDPLAELPLASETSNMTHLFTDKDPIKCSPAYKDNNVGQTPPVRYFIARNEGNPLVILVNQDEANEFKSHPRLGWSLYDIRYQGSEGIVPVCGEKINAVKDPLLKKLNFAANRLEVKGQTVDAIATSLEGVFTKKQLEPKLDIKFSSTKNFSKEEPVFDFKKWGFDGIDQEKIQVKITQVEEPVLDEKNHPVLDDAVNPYKHSGVAIILQVSPKLKTEHVQVDHTQSQKKPEQAEVFISSVLNKRIEVQDNPKLTEVVNIIRHENAHAMDERKQIRKEISDIQEAKAKKRAELTGTLEWGAVPEGKKIVVKGKIPALEQQISEKIQVAKEKIAKQHEESLANYINYREKAKNSLGARLSSIWRLKLFNEGEFGTRVFNKNHKSLCDVYSHCIKELYLQNNKKALTQDQIAQKIDEYVNGIFQAGFKRYQETICCGEGSVLRALLKAAKESPAKHKITIEPKCYEDTLLLDMVNIPIQEVINECGKVKGLTEEVFLERLSARVRDFFEKHNEKQKKVDADTVGKLLMSKISSLLKIDTNSNPEIRINGKSLEEYLWYELLDHKVNDSNTPHPSEKSILWKQFIPEIQKEVIECRNVEGLTEELFLERLSTRVRVFLKKSNDKQKDPRLKLDVSEFEKSLMPKIYMSLNTESKEKNLDVIAEDMKKVIYEGLLQTTTTPNEDQKRFYKVVNEVLNSKRPISKFKLPPELLDYDKAPVNFDIMRAAIVEQLAIQHVQMPKLEIDDLAKEMIECVNGRKAYDKILSNFNALGIGKRPGCPYLDTPDGNKVKGSVFKDVYNIMTALDKEVLPLQEQLQKARAQYKSDMGKLEEQHQEIRVRSEQNNERVKESKKEMSALNKLIHGLKNLFGRFTEHHVKVEQNKPIDVNLSEKEKEVIKENQALEFIDDHFKVGQIVTEKSAADVGIIFTPPEYYDAQRNIYAQVEQLHGLNPISEEGTVLSELQCGDTFKHSVEHIKSAAAIIKTRDFALSGLKAKQVFEQEKHNITLDRPLGNSSQSIKKVKKKGRLIEQTNNQPVLEKSKSSEQPTYKDKALESMLKENKINSAQTFKKGFVDKALNRNQFQNSDWENFAHECKNYIESSNFKNNLKPHEQANRIQILADFKDIDSESALEHAVAYVIKAIATPASNSDEFGDTPGMNDFIKAVNDKNNDKIHLNIKNAIKKLTCCNEKTDLTKKHITNAEDDISKKSDDVVKNGRLDFNLGVKPNI